MKKLFSFAICLAFTVHLQAQDASEYPSTLVNDYNATILNLVKTTGIYTACCCQSLWLHWLNFI
jgi:hypothetical protein